MTRSAARMQRWLLASAPVMAACGLRWHAGGAAAALLIWLGIGALLPCRERYPYPRKRVVPLHRLFFCFALAVFFTGWAVRIIGLLKPGDTAFARLLSYAGAAGFSLPISKKALRVPLSPKLSWGLGALLCAFFLLSLLL